VGFSPSNGSSFGDADLFYVARSGPGHTEDVQMVVEPAHRVLKGDVQVPEAVGLGYLDSPPDGRIHPDEGQLELIDLSCRLHPAARRLAPDEGLCLLVVLASHAAFQGGEIVLGSEVIAASFRHLGPYSLVACSSS
jgi:hypothetical protein